MEKNYYELLGVATDASTEEIMEAFETIRKEKYPDGLATEDETKRAEYMDLFNAKKILTDVDTRLEYDESLRKSSKSGIKNLQVNEKAKSVLKNEKVRFAALIVAAAFIGSMLGNGFSNYFGNKNTRNGDNNSTSIVNEIDTSEPITEEKLLTAENFEEKVQEVIDYNLSKGMNIDPTFTRDAMFVLNIDYLSQEDIAKLYSKYDLNISEVVSNADNYFLELSFHNMFKDMNNVEFISLLPLIYDEEDKKILTELEDRYISLVDGLKNGTMTSEQYQQSFDDITEFLRMYDGFTIDGQDWKFTSLSIGPSYVAYLYYWPLFSTAYTYNGIEYLTSENQTDIMTLSGQPEKGIQGVFDPSKHLPFILNHDNILCLENGEYTMDSSSEKTLTKTQ